MPAGWSARRALLQLEGAADGAASRWRTRHRPCAGGQPSVARRLRAAGGHLGLVVPVHAPGHAWSSAPLPTAAVRVVIAAAVPAAAAAGCAAWRRSCAGTGRRRALLGLLNSAIPFACFAFALLSITTGLSAILNATVPLFGALVAWVWLKDRPQRLAHGWAWSIGFAGVALLAWDKASFKPGASGIAPGLGGAGLPAGDAVLRHRRPAAPSAT